MPDQAREIARTGAAREALPLYREALDLAPEVPAIRRDYAVVLGWAERFSDAKEHFQRVLESQPDQPEWVWREIAQTELMAGDPAAALASLDRAIEAGDASEKTLARKALALRRLRQSEQAEALYRRIHEEFPRSETGVVGMVQYPLLVSGVLAKRLHPSLRLLLEGGYNSSSIRRVNPLGPAYSYSHVAVSLESRFD